MFLNPLMLFGLTAVSVPIIIHLLNRRKFQRVVWAAMRFLRLSVEQNQRRIDIEDLIILILRCLLVALLALALAKPELRASLAGVLGSTKVTAVIVLDNSYSMTRSDGTNSSMQSAKAAAEQIVKSLPPGASVSLVLASDIAHEVIGEPTEDRELAISEIRNAPIFDRPTNLLEGVRWATGLLKDRPSTRKELYVVTDGQLSGFRQLDSVRAILNDARRNDVRSYMVFVGGGQDQNLGITQMHLGSGLTPVDQPVAVDVTVKNWGATEVKNVTVKAGIDNDDPTAEGTIPSIPGGQEGTITLRPTPRTDGFHTITARLQPDRLPADDTRTVGLRAVKTIRLLMIEGASGRIARDTELFYVRNALMPVRRTERENYYIQFTVRSASDLANVDFAEYDAVIGANVPDFAENVATQLVNYVRGGGGLILFAGEKISPTFYNEQLFKRYGLLPAMLGPAYGDATQDEKYFTLSTKDYDHEIVSIWRDPAAGTLASAHFYRAFELKIDDTQRTAGPQSAASGAAQAVLKFSNDNIAMAVRDYGQGRVVLFASTANAEWCDLPPRGQFVPLMDRTLQHVLARKNEHLTVRAGEEFVHTLPARYANLNLRVSRPTRPYGDAEKGGGDETRAVEVEGGTPVLRVKATDFAGAYEVPDAQLPVVRFAVQADSEESNPATLDERQIEQLADVSKVIRADGSQPLEQTLASVRGGTRLWMALIWAALGLAAVETLLAHWFSKSK